MDDAKRLSVELKRETSVRPGRRRYRRRHAAICYSGGGGHVSFGCFAS